MDTPRLSELHNHRGPFLTVYADVTRDAADGAQEVEIRWKNHEARLRGQGAPEDLVTRVGKRVVEPTGIGGATGRLIIATEQDGILRDELIPCSPRFEVAAWSPLPDTMAWLADRETLTPVLVVLVDHVGADFSLHRGWPDEAAEQWHVDGESAHANKVHHPRVSGGHGAQPGGEASQQPRGDLQSRTQEVQRENARAVAAEIDRVADRAQLIALAGEPDACADVLADVGPTTAQRIVALASGSRAEDGADDAIDAQVAEAVEQYLDDQRDELLEEFEEARGRGEGAAVGIHDTLAGAVRGQVATLLLDPGAAMLVHVRPEEVEGLDLTGGVGELDQSAEYRGDQLAIAAAAQTSADVRVVRQGALTADGVAGLLRWEM